jgi:ABC-type multidrug transport system fused ATPase/permease subunit
MSILIEDLSYSYSGKQVLKSINLAVRQGEAVGIVGFSGGGKSTLLKLVSGLYDVQRGSITVMGLTHAADRRKNTAMVIQSAGLFPASIRDNITCGHEMNENGIRRACDAAQMTKWIDSLPDGLDTHLGERGEKVSGGEAQRIAIARAIAKNAPVVLLDEPTSALDNETGAAVITALEGLTRGKTVLHVSHRPETLAWCDRIFRLDGGCLYAC